MFAKEEQIQYHDPEVKHEFNPCHPHEPGNKTIGFFPCCLNQDATIEQGNSSKQNKQ